MHDASNPSLSLTNIQVVSGNQTNTFYADYPDIYDIKVKDLTIDQNLTPVSTTISGNQIKLSQITDPTHNYQLSYKLAKSFIADHEWVDEYGLNRTRLLYDKDPDSYNVDGYLIDYEDSIFNPATLVDLPLSPLYTSLTEGAAFE